MSTATEPLTLAEARRNYEAVVSQVETDRRAMREAARLEAKHLDEQRAAHTEVLRAEARESRNDIAVGTPVRHRMAEDITGVVIPNDGSGLAVRNDATGTETHGYIASEWVAR